MRAWLLAALVLFAAPAAAETLRLEGTPIQGGLMRGQVAAGATVTVDGRPARVAEDGRFVFGFGRNHGETALVEARLVDGAIERRTLTVAQRAYEVQRIDGLARDKVTFTAEQLDRIRSDQAAVRAARGHDTPALDFTAGFDWPVAGRITGVYGSARILNGEPRQPHYGIDIAAPAGTPVVAAAGGVVRLAKPLYLPGLTVILDHGHGLSSSYLHLSEALVAEGARVEKGETIGLVGSSGRSTGAHLDWRVNWGSVRLDPELVAGPMPDAESR